MSTNKLLFAILLAACFAIGCTFAVGIPLAHHLRLTNVERVLNDWRERALVFFTDAAWRL